MTAPGRTATAFDTRRAPRDASTVQSPSLNRNVTTSAGNVLRFAAVGRLVGAARFAGAVAFFAGGAVLFGGAAFFADRAGAADAFLAGAGGAAAAFAGRPPRLPTASSLGANGTSSRPSRTTMNSPSDGLPIRTTLPRVPAGTAADAVRTTTRGFSPAESRARRSPTSLSVSAGGPAGAFFRGGTAKDYDRRHTSRPARCLVSQIVNRALALTATIAVATCAVAASTATAAPAPKKGAVVCAGDPSIAHRLDLTVAGTKTFGFYAVPRGKAKGIVVFDHGYGHTAYSWVQHVKQVAARDGVIAIAMDYRFQHDSPPAKGETLPSSRGWRVSEGAQDSIAAAQLFDRSCRTGGVNTIYGVSMGGNTSGLVVAAKPTRADGKPLFDYWFAIEPAVNVTETWAEATAVAKSGNTFAVNAAADIEEETGGTPVTATSAYESRTVVARISDIAAAGLKGVAVVQGVDDGLVPYNQTRELVTELRANRIPTYDATVLTRGAGEAGTTLSGNVLGEAGQESPLAGHASEVSNTQLVGVTGFNLLDELYSDKTAPGCADSVVDGDTQSSFTASC